VNHFNVGTEGFATTSSGYTAFVTWDATNLYLGYTGPDVGITNPSKWLLVYLDTRSGTSGMSVGTTLDTQHAAFPAGFTADYELLYRLDGTLLVRKIIGGVWTTFAQWPPVLLDYNGSFLELAIPFAMLDDAPTVGVTALMVNEQAYSEWSYAGLYADSFTDGYYQAIPIAHDLLVDRSSTLAPNAAQNEQ